MERTLLLNATYEPLKVIDWQRAVTLLWQGKVEVLEVYNREIRSISWSTRQPAVLRLFHFVKIEYHKRAINFSRANIFLRDNYSCQYCGKHFRTEELTFDHVVPIAKGGRKVWENIVTACWRCNNKKSGRTPREARMHLIKLPARPDWKPFFTFTIGLRNVPTVWRDYLYWNVELDHDQQ
jgi:5-methylcytosine-specific restriction endonuclease McrA